jgi:hypothetical protein
MTSRKLSTVLSGGAENAARSSEPVPSVIDTSFTLIDLFAISDQR